MTCCLCAEGDGETDLPPSEVITDTEVWVWGDNQKGQLGLGDTVNRLALRGVASVCTILQMKGERDKKQYEMLTTYCGALIKQTSAVRNSVSRASFQGIPVRLLAQTGLSRFGEGARQTHAFDKLKYICMTENIQMSYHLLKDFQF